MLREKWETASNLSTICRPKASAVEVTPQAFVCVQHHALLSVRFTF